MYKIYTAGPMSGLKYTDVCEWRNQVEESLSPFGVCVLSPLRGTEGNTSTYSDTAATDTNLSPRAIFVRDRNDVYSSDLVFVNLTGAKKASIGTMFEIAWAHHLRIPTVVVMEEGNVHDHLFVNETVDFLCRDVKSGIRVAADVLGIKKEESFL